MGRYAVTAAAVALAAATASSAEVKSVKLGVDFFNQAYTFNFDPANSITFTTIDKSFFAYNPAGVSTGGTTQVGSFGAPFYDPPQPTTYSPFRGQSFGPGANLPLFVSFAAPATVPFSIVEVLLGFRFDQGNGYQYGYADLAGSTLYGVRYETTPGAAVALAAVPEPATWALMIAGFGFVGAAVRTRRAALA